LGVLRLRLVHDFVLVEDGSNLHSDLRHGFLDGLVKLLLELLSEPLFLLLHAVSPFASHLFAASLLEHLPELSLVLPVFLLTFPVLPVLSHASVLFLLSLGFSELDKELWDGLDHLAGSVDLLLDGHLEDDPGLELSRTLDSQEVGLDVIEVHRLGKFLSSIGLDNLSAVLLDSSPVHRLELVLVSVLHLSLESVDLPLDKALEFPKDHEWVVFSRSIVKSFSPLLSS